MVVVIRVSSGAASPEWDKWQPQATTKVDSKWVGFMEGVEKSECALGEKQDKWERKLKKQEYALPTYVSSVRNLFSIRADEGKLLPARLLASLPHPGRELSFLAGACPPAALWFPVLPTCTLNSGLHCSPRSKLFVEFTVEAELVNCCIDVIPEVSPAF